MQNESDIRTTKNQEYMCHEYRIREINGVKYVQFLDAYGNVEFEQPLLYENIAEKKVKTEVAPVLVEVPKKKNQ